MAPHSRLINYTVALAGSGIWDGDNCQGYQRLSDTPLRARLTLAFILLFNFKLTLLIYAESHNMKSRLIKPPKSKPQMIKHPRTLRLAKLASADEL